MSISQGDRIHLLRDRTLAIYSKKNPNAPVSTTIDHETYMSRVVGKMTITLQPPESGPYQLPPCCPTTCTKPSPTPIFVSGLGYPAPPPYDLSYNIYFIIEWTPFPDATSYIITTDCTDENIVVSTGLTSAIIYINWNGSPPFTTTVTGINSCGTASAVSDLMYPCFLAGSRVAMADGTEKPIEDIVCGDSVLGAFGEHNTVLALHRPLMGSSRMCRINGEHSSTTHHPHITSEKQFVCVDPDRVIKNTYGRMHPVIKPDGSVGFWKLHGLRADRIQTLSLGTTLKTIEGSRPVSTLDIYTMPTDTQLYNLVVGGSHTYHVDGYAVTGWPREDDFDYDIWAPRS